MSAQASRDGGLQAERTALAWRRTALSATAVTAVVVVHGVAGRGWGLSALPFAFSACAALVVVVVSLVTARRRRDDVSASPRAVAVVSAAVLCCALWVGVVVACVPR
ncbi:MULTISPECIES: DUF202 domain-containing protein [unclassified Rhodococcus (in: high G+C Gram-positive bacteria)]|uniref:DUF202 domain-containing protein n=1 Tax=unclassified Rhodococcus (in: high G+C Gram-positive bacteria) TaxID=192944 RepID=UPI000D332B3C